SHVVAGSAENAAPEPVPVKVAAPSTRANPPPKVDGASPALLDAELSQSAPAEVSTALLPRVLTPSWQAPPLIQPPRIPTTQMPTAQAPVAADLPSAEGPPTAPKHPSNPANRSETSTARRNNQPHRQQAFSLKNWLQQLGILPRNTRG